MARPSALGLAAAAWLLGCGPPALQVPAERLVAGPGQAARAILADEERPVLSGFERATLAASASLRVPASGRLRLQREIPEALAHHAELVLSARLGTRGEWETLPARRVRVRRRGETAFVELAASLGAERASQVALLQLEALAAPTWPARHETGPLAIPAAAELCFGMGILEPGWEQGPVTFRISACEAGECEAIFEETLDPAGGPGRRWQDRRVALGAHANRTLSLRFEADGRGEFSFPVWSSPALYVERPRRDTDWNLLLISLDTLRADHLPSYGYPLDTAPFLTRHFASQGTIFESLVAAAATTRPSHASLFTSLQPSVHGLDHPGTLLPAAVETLAGALWQAGFDTAAATENAVLDVRNGIGRGFDSYAENKRREEQAAEGHIEETLAAGLEWIERHRQRRFFVFLHTYQTHGPYRPPERYAGLFPEPAPGFEPHPDLLPDQQPALYDREIRYADDVLRELFERLAALGLLERTLVVVTSDHGEEFLEHGELGHGAQLHGEVLNVPLLLRGPGIPRGLRVSEPVAHVDLMPTLLELAGVAPPEGLMGRSLTPLLRGASLPARPVFSETRPVGHEQPDLAVRLGARKLLRQHTPDGVRHRYYDLSRDPGEERDLFAEESAAARELLALLDRYSADAARRRAALLEAGPGPPALAPDPERDAKLRALGYLE